MYLSINFELLKQSTTLWITSDVQGMRRNCRTVGLTDGRITIADLMKWLEWFAMKRLRPVRQQRHRPHQFLNIL